MTRIISMSINELNKVEIIGKVAQKSLTQHQAADILNITSRQIRRLLKKYQENGASAISQKRERPSNHQLPSCIKELALALIKAHYHDFGPTLAHEKLTEVHKIDISLWSVRNIMIANNLWIDKKIKKQRVHQLRKRRSREGELVQMDGSPHAWFEDRGPYCTLIHCVDDATSKVLVALFVPSESIWSYFSLMKAYFKKLGKPVAFYIDKHGVFRVNAPEALSGEGITQFGRAMQELGILMIFANSAQAKGRIERKNSVFQDRLVKELRLRGISTPEAGNAFLPEYLEDLNGRFAVAPEDPNNAHRPLLKEQDLELIFTIQSFRVLSKNLTIQYKNTIYQIHSDRESYALRKAKVCVREKENGAITILYKGKSLSFSTYDQQQKQGEIVDSKRLNEVMDSLQLKEKVKYKPSNSHPWKRSPRRAVTTQKP